MNKRKVFKFEISDYVNGSDGNAFKTIWYENNTKKLICFEDIDSILNNFIKDKEYIDIKVNTIDITKNNTVLNNTVILEYTIDYKDILF